VIAAEYQRTPQMIRNWVRSGFIVEIGFSVRKDITGHYIIGVPTSDYEKFERAKPANQRNQPVANLSQTL
jgi:hypothetical protein